ncbi:hypothetical protein NVP1121O_172 [Vibrio phage 1.121.O._10N.286.46.C4]|nr:hypothetical protein NVP1121O_172 [Vibrio phage 1.121.O._10N.286.46.C4]
MKTVIGKVNNNLNLESLKSQARVKGVPENMIEELNDVELQRMVTYRKDNRKGDDV